jgi:formamidopyrimidine-DNA glycosylase
MPEAPQMQALAERLEEAAGGKVLQRLEPLQFAALKTFDPDPMSLRGRTLESVGRRGKYLIAEFGGGLRVLVHLSQGGRVDIEDPPKTTKGKQNVVRFVFEGGPAILVKEWGTERKAGWWVLGAGDDGPLDKLGPEATSDEFAEWVRTSDDRRRVHTILRDQRTVSGIGRGYTDDSLHRARLSPYASLASLK